MFIHSVLFEVKPRQVKAYRQDSKVWARFARQAKGFKVYLTVQRNKQKNQYASVYVWKDKVSHTRFMRKFHDWLVSKSQAKVKVLGYYNFQGLDQIK